MYEEGLTCTIGAEQCKDFTPRHTKGHSIDGKVAAVRLADVAYAQLVFAVIDSDYLAIHVFISVLTLFCILRAGLCFIELVWFVYNVMGVRTRTFLLRNAGLYPLS